MTTPPSAIFIGRWDRADRAQIRVLSDLLADYHRQTESEKGTPVAAIDALPARYRPEVVDPVAAFAGDVVLLARSGDRGAGCVVITDAGQGRVEIKRLWTAPEYRGRRVASGLLDAFQSYAVAVGADTIRLSVWHWRADAIALYRKLGFTESPSWETREGLICMTRVV
ncbi:GNAT family N-acetyltransferase [Microbacterium sp. GXS0129]|uniref:GNAT family N-acetyltransferase n=1 Tax=Microbacterium sp. GXS0129 TaxID=3377836 RepID=UPI00383ABCDE